MTVRRLQENLRQIQDGFPERRVERIVIDALPEDAPEPGRSRLLFADQSAREERFAAASDRVQTAAGLLFVTAHSVHHAESATDSSGLHRY